MISFTVDMSSVCMGDDMESHAVGYTMSDEADLAALFEQLKHDGFFPSIQGNNGVWVLMSGDNCIFAYFTKSGRVFPDISSLKISDIISPDSCLRFLYVTSPANWKSHILRGLGDVEVRDEEIAHCDFLMGDSVNE